MGHVALLERKVDIRVIQVLLDHKKLETTSALGRQNLQFRTKVLKLPRV